MRSSAPATARRVASRSSAPPLQMPRFKPRLNRPQYPVLADGLYPTDKDEPGEVRSPFTSPPGERYLCRAGGRGAMSVDDGTKRWAELAPYQPGAQATGRRTRRLRSGPVGGAG